jgi:hypothetical protein
MLPGGRLTSPELLWHVMAQLDTTGQDRAECSGFCVDVNREFRIAHRRKVAPRMTLTGEI